MSTATDNSTMDTNKRSEKDDARLKKCKSNQFSQDSNNPSSKGQAPSEDIGTKYFDCKFLRSHTFNQIRNNIFVKISRIFSYSLKLD